ncbi:MAG: P-loop NTPase fold protein [Oscillospiraceae bacterium]
MKICDFCSTAKILMDFIGESKNINQIDFMYELFKDFMESDEAKDFDFDNGLVCRWLNGTAKLSPKITAYYSALGNLEAMAIDIEENILPLFYDKDMAVTELYDLLMSDTTVSETKSKSLQTIIHTKMMLIYQTSLVSLSFGMERKFIKRDATQKLIASGAFLLRQGLHIALSPNPVSICGRDNELEKLHTTLEDENKIFIQGIAGIGKSEFVKMYAQKYKKNTRTFCISAMAAFKANDYRLDFADDSLTDGKNILLKA